MAKRGGKRNPIHKSLEMLAAISDTPKSPEAQHTLTQVLENGQGLGVAKAAKIIATVACGPDTDDTSAYEEILDENWTRLFLPPLANAFNRLLHEPTQDTGAHGKLAAAKALNRMACWDNDLFQKAAACIQLEPEMGGMTDRAASLRAEGLFGLVRLRDENRFRIMTDLLWDNLQDARIGAVRAALYDGSETAEILLRAKAHAGDKGPDVMTYPPDGGAAVMGEIFSGLLALGRNANVPFVANFMNDENKLPPIRDEAAMALGASRLPEALDALAAAWPNCIKEGERERVLCGVAMQGTDAAMETLTKWAGEADSRTQALYKRVLESVWGEGSPRLRHIFK